MKFHNSEPFKYSTMYGHMIVMNMWDYAQVSGWHLKFGGVTIHFKQFNIFIQVHLIKNYKICKHVLVKIWPFI